MNVTIDWQQISASVTVSFAVGAVIWRLIVMGVKEKFAPLDAHTVLQQRMTDAERRLGEAPGHTDFAQLNTRIAAVETGVAVAQATITGIETSVKRTEHMVDLLVKHQMNEGRST